MSDAALHDHDARISACPACDAVPLAQRVAARGGAGGEDVILSLPTIHCAACITDVEAVLRRHPGVREARVNLTLRRVTIDAPGLSAADLIPVVERIGYEAHELDPAALAASAADRQGRDILMRIGVSGFAMMNIMILSVAVWSGAEAATRDMFHWISGAIALPTVAFAGQPFFSSAWRALKAGRLGMDVPISLALILASAISVYETMNSGDHAYFDAAVMLCFFLLVGRYLVPAFGGASLTLPTSPAALLALWLMACAVSLAAVCWALLIASLVRTSEQATVIGGIGNILMGAVGGIMVPQFLMPPAMRALAKASPMAWGLEGFHTVLLRHGGIGDIWPYAAGLLLFAAASLLAAALAHVFSVHRHV
jgi:copper chaperone CopZ